MPPAEDSAGRNRLGRRPPLPPDQPVDPRVRDLAVHDAVFPQGPFTHEPELLQHAGGCRVACVGLGLDAIQVQRVECPPQQNAGGLCRVAVAPRCIVEAEAKRCTAVVRIPPGQTAPADERPTRSGRSGRSLPALAMHKHTACRLPALRWLGSPEVRGASDNCAPSRRNGRLAASARPSELRPKGRSAASGIRRHDVTVDVMQQPLLCTCLTGAPDRQEMGFEVA
jgi:hypothetical protein